MAKKKKKNSKPVSASKDPTLRRKYDVALAKARSARAKETVDFDKLYESIGAIIDHEPPLYLADGYKTVRAFLAAELPGVTERTARMNVKVATHFDAAHEETFGLVRLSLLVDYLTLANKGKAPVGSIDPTRAKVRVPVGGTSHLAPFAKCDVDVMRSVVKYAKVGRQAIGTEPTVVTRVRKALVKAGFARVTISVNKGVVALGRIDQKEIANVAEVIAMNAR